MKKKIGVLVCALFVFVSTNVFAGGPFGLTGFGIYGSIAGSTTGSTGGGIGLSLKWGSFPVVGLQYKLGTDSTSIAASFDYYILDAYGLIDALSLFLGAGLYTGITLGDPMGFDFGARIPIGLQFWPIRKLEIFVSGMPLIGFVPSPSLSFGAELGLRVHF